MQRVRKRPRASCDEAVVQRDLTSLLPIDVLTVIFQRLPLPARLIVGGQVCRRWRIAVMRSITKLSLNRFGPSTAVITATFPCVSKMRISLDSCYLQEPLPTTLQELLISFSDEKAMERKEKMKISPHPPEKLTSLTLPPHAPLQLFLPWFKQLSSRLTRLSFCLPARVCNLLEDDFLMRSHLSSLTSLSLFFDSRHVEPLVNFLRRHSSQIVSLKLNGLAQHHGNCILPHVSFLFPVLRTLSLSFIQDVDVLALIRFSPQLKELRLYGGQPQLALALLRAPQLQAIITRMHCLVGSNALSALAACPKIEEVDKKVCQAALQDRRMVMSLLARLSLIRVDDLRLFSDAVATVCLSRLQQLSIGLVDLPKMPESLLDMPHLLHLSVHRGFPHQQSWVSLESAIIQVTFLVKSSPRLRSLELGLHLGKLTIHGVDMMIRFLHSMNTIGLEEVSLRYSGITSRRLMAVAQTFLWMRVPLSIGDEEAEVRNEMSGEGDAWEEERDFS